MKINRIVHEQTLAYYIFDKLKYATRYLRMLGTGEHYTPPMAYSVNELKLYALHDRSKELLHIKGLQNLARKPTASVVG